MLSSFLNRLRLSPKLMIAFLLVGIIPFVIMGLIALDKAQTALSQQAFNQIESVKAIKSEQIKRFFDERKGDISILGETVANLKGYVSNRLNVIRGARTIALDLYFDSLKQNLKSLSEDYNTLEALKQFKVINSEDWKRAEKQFASHFSSFAQGIKAQDLLLISAEGDIIYSLQKAGDLGLNINDPRLRGSGLSQAFKASQANSPALGDMAIYPFGGKPLFFAIEALKDGEGKFSGALALAFSPDPLNQIMGVRTGLGKTGETYLVGPDYLMRSDSFLDKSNRSVFSSLLNPATGKVETLAARNALNGKEGLEILKDYNGNAVLSAYAPFNIWGSKWALIAEIDVAEAFVPLGQDGKEFYKKYVDTYGYYDLFLFAPEGDAFYTVAKEADYKTNFVNGKYSDSNLGKLFREVVKSKKYAMTDFEPYAPSNGEPAAFIALPVIGSNGNIDVVVGLQLSLTAINDIMQKRDGLGKTGETYMVGPDYLMRSDSFLDPINHSVKASFANPLKGKVETKAAKAALGGKSGSEIIIDYNGNPVLSSYTPINLEGVNWALIAEIDEAEAFAAIKALKLAMLVIGLIGAAVIAGVALLVARSLARPIMAMTGAMRELSHGNLEIIIPARERADELGDMSQALQIFKDNTQEKIRLEAEARAQEQAQREAEEKQREREAAAIMEVAVVTQAASQGDINARIRLDDKEGFFKDIAQGVNGMAEVTGNALSDVNKVLKAVAGGDLSQRIVNNYQGIFAELKQATNQTADKLREIVDSINTATSEIASAASQVAAGSSDLSERSEEQASSLEETAASMEEISATVKQNSSNAQTAKELAKSTENTASGGDQVVSQAIVAMDKILESSKKIEDIVGMIDEIAFQTNLLALNAAVEAARAGDAGKGFAVVAQEVRNLAQRSALASKDIKTLIAASGREVVNGAQLVKNSGENLGNIARGIQQLSRIVSEIADAGQEQASGIEQINQAVSQMDEMTQRNAALVEESTAAARSLEEQAQYLKNLMSFFK